MLKIKNFKVIKVIRLLLSRKKFPFAMLWPSKSLPLQTLLACSSKLNICARNQKSITNKKVRQKKFQTSQTSNFFQCQFWCTLHCTALLFSLPRPLLLLLLLLTFNFILIYQKLPTVKFMSTFAAVAVAAAVINDRNFLLPNNWTQINFCKTEPEKRW